MFRGEEETKVHQQQITPPPPTRAMPIERECDGVFNDMVEENLLTLRGATRVAQSALTTTTCG